ncbi:MAG: hypothetical protein HRU20_22555 [Pseudomonadales bacterium]|nr:hypothetical protein [Pseudomonadales bacterium]
MFDNLKNLGEIAKQLAGVFVILLTGAIMLDYTSSDDKPAKSPTHQNNQ